MDNANDKNLSGSNGRYAARGVSSSKDEVHAVVDKIDKGLFPGAFCKITPDFLTNNPEFCATTHADGSGTKSLLAYLYWKETGDASVYRGISQDSIVMNIDDLLCIGVTGNCLISSTINRNAKSIPGEVLAHLIQGNEEFLQLLRDYGVDIRSGGGETADVGDLTPTCTVDSCATAILRRDKVIDASRIRPGLAIVALASSGTCAYETVENSGISSNGLTSARHEMLCKYYAEKYPETFDAHIPSEFVYCGPYRLEDKLPGSTLTVGKALLSPTRTYAPFVLRLLKELPLQSVFGLIHNSGGALTKCIRFGQGVRYVKNNLLPTPPIFKAIQETSKTDNAEMHRVYNMGQRLEVYVEPKDVPAVLQLAQSLKIQAQQIGYTEASTDPAVNQVVVTAASGEVIEY
ncbi:MAG: hypothetical protein K6B46_01490 [Opitutales bacterium]|nr:hypothetical protein [Opitutales bacterium]